RHRVREPLLRDGNGCVLGPPAAADREALLGDAVRALLQPVRPPAALRRTGLGLPRVRRRLADVLLDHGRRRHTGDAAARPRRAAGRRGAGARGRVVWRRLALQLLERGGSGGVGRIELERLRERADGETVESLMLVAEAEVVVCRRIAGVRLDDLLE